MPNLTLTSIIEEISNMPAEQRNTVENLKEEAQFEAVLANKILTTAKKTNPDILISREEFLEDAEDAIKQYYNIIVAMIALCETEEEVLRESTRIRVLGRLAKKHIRKNIPDDVKSRIKMVMVGVSKELEHGVIGSNDKRLVRLKVQHASNKLAALIKRHGLETELIPWPNCNIKELD